MESSLGARYSGCQNVQIRWTSPDPMSVPVARPSFLSLHFPWRSGCSHYLFVLRDDQCLVILCIIPVHSEALLSSIYAITVHCLILYVMGRVSAELFSVSLAKKIFQSFAQCSFCDRKHLKIARNSHSEKKGIIVQLKHRFSRTVLGYRAVF